jgi:hypothetical protein
MNRKIKFRYWNDVIKQMVNDPPMPYKDGWTVEQLFSDRGWVWMQFTGLLDRNGKEIYESDICKWETTGPESEVVIDQIIWENFPACFSFGKGETMACHDHLEVIGNIYENPELLN